MGGVGGVGGWTAGVGLYIPSIETQAVVPCLQQVTKTETCSPQDRPRQSLAAVWHPMHPY